MIGTATSACLLPLQPDLRHHRAMDTEESGGKSLRLRVSAWLPPGLALAWLATLATLVRGVGMALAAWGATVSALLLAGLLMHRLRRDSLADDGDPAAGNEDAAAGETARASTRPPTDPAGSALQPDPADSSATGVKDPDSDPGLTAGTPVAPRPPVPELRVLTAEEAASVLRVDAELVKTSISSGEFPGNRIGPHWRVEQGALTRWLQGTYRS
jgi:excisionase family DNA binding protein